MLGRLDTNFEASLRPLEAMKEASERAGTTGALAASEEELGDVKSSGM